MERVSREFFILTSMEHPNVIRLHRVEHQGGTLYLVMELAPGGSLKMLLRRAGKAGSNAVRRRRRRLSSAGVPALVPPRVASAPSSPIAGNPVRPRRPSAAAALGRSGVGLGEPAARWLFQQLCRAVSYCHRHRVVHRDLKPDNVLVGAGGRLKVADFGLSIAVSAGGRASSPVGTPLYSAPEVLFGLQDVKEACARRGDATCDGRPASGHRTGSEAEDGLSGYAASAADVWSLGVMLFELCFGALPFPAQTRRDLRRMVLERRLVVPARGRRLVLAHLLGPPHPGAAGRWAERPPGSPWDGAAPAVTPAFLPRATAAASSASSSAAGANGVPGLHRAGSGEGGGAGLRGSDTEASASDACPPSPAGAGTGATTPAGGVASLAMRKGASGRGLASLGRGDGMPPTSPHSLAGGRAGAAAGPVELGRRGRSVSQPSLQQPPHLQTAAAGDDGGAARTGGSVRGIDRDGDDGDDGGGGGAPTTIGPPSTVAGRAEPADGDASASRGRRPHNLRVQVRNDAAVPAQPLPAPPAAALRDDLHAPPVIVNVAPRQMSPHHSPTGTPAARSRCSSRAGDAPPHALTVDVAETSASGPLRDLLASMLALDPSLRPPIDSVLAHPWMRTVASALPHLASGVSLVPTPTSTTAASRADPDASALGLALPSFSGASDGNASPTSSILGGAEHHPSSRRPHRGTDPDADEGTAILAALGVEGPEWLAGFAAIVLAPSETSTSDGGAACSDAGSQRSCGEGRSSVGPSAATGSATPAAGSGSAGAARVSDAGGPVDSISRAEAENKALYANPNLAIDMDGDVDVAIPSPAAGKTKSESRGLGAPWSVPVAGAAVAALSSSSAGGGAGAASRPRAATAAAAPDDHGEGLVPAAPPSHRMASGPSPLQHAHRQALRPIGHARHTRDRRDHDDGASAPASRASSRDGSSRRLLGLGRDPSPPTVVGGVSSGHPLDRVRGRGAHRSPDRAGGARTLTTPTRRGAASSLLSPQEWRGGPRTPESATGSGSGRAVSSEPMGAVGAVLAAARREAATALRAVTGQHGRPEAMAGSTSTPSLPAAAGTGPPAQRRHLARLGAGRGRQRSRRRSLPQTLGAGAGAAVGASAPHTPAEVGARLLPLPAAARQRSGPRSLDHRHEASQQPLSQAAPGQLPSDAPSRAGAAAAVPSRAPSHAFQTPAIATPPRLGARPVLRHSGAPAPQTAPLMAGPVLFPSRNPAAEARDAAAMPPPQTASSRAAARRRHHRPAAVTVAQPTGSTLPRSQTSPSLQPAGAGPDPGGFGTEPHQAPFAVSAATATAPTHRVLSGTAGVLLSSGRSSGGESACTAPPQDTTAQAGTGGLTQASGPLAGPLAGMLPAMAQPSFRSRLRRVQSGKSSASGSTGGGPRGTTPTSGAPPPM